MQRIGPLPASDMKSHTLLLSTVEGVSTSTIVQHVLTYIGAEQNTKWYGEHVGDDFIRVVRKYFPSTKSCRTYRDRMQP